LLNVSKNLSEVTKVSWKILQSNMVRERKLVSNEDVGKIVHTLWKEQLWMEAFKSLSLS